MFDTVEISILKDFEKREDSITIIAPGRVNLIGEHTDYNNGFVFPAAISLAIYGKALKRNDAVVNVYSIDMNEEKKIPISDNYEKNGDWSDYIKGVIIELSRIKPLKYGVDVAFKSEVPMGSGLSSSAAFELINAKLLSYVNDIELSNKELALLCQRAENNFIGVKCGIMDQFAVALGEQDAALFLDTMTLDYEVVKLNLNNYKIVISNTNKPRQLSDSKYNERRAECEQVVSIFNKLNPEIKSLRDVNINFLESNKTHLDTVLYKRAKHVISENKRVLDSVKFLKSGSLNKFGELMVESHNSLRNLYEVSCKELDTLVDEFVKYDGVLGSRMTGAGFGGCTVSIINNSSIDEIIKKVDMVYQDKTGLKAEHYIVDAESGVRIIK